MDPSYFTRPVDLYKLKEHSKIIETNRGILEKNGVSFFQTNSLFCTYSSQN